MTNDDITFRKPVSEDGAAIWELVRACKPLDENSMYCNLIQCDHFADTCILAELAGEPVGWISGYIRPDEPETLFVWQVAVSELARGRGLGSKMLRNLLAREECAGVSRMQTTITRDNEASWALFSRFAEKVGGDLEDEPHFKRDDHFDGAHATEHMVTITLTEDGEMQSAA
ncbi:L-2,4-diaminobutyric acid acetyltransferase [Jannaschia seosinensis]|uniref:L-2,4-diaminobutyric acid acetyltransferase n=1 Tax=Jannaschia seosinensis TaxID=313367 RepID=A0A0M7BDN5_9RHOB|nr:diaminobutyrate acetyltransferase [Jannaschia seosinensis]CUH39465.1 L-2,4-diaminobutyric acid acetyltransferase [Jannaschia seosinensis]